MHARSDSPGLLLHSCLNNNSLDTRAGLRLLGRLLPVGLQRRLLEWMD
jgi:hypothetical protein